MNKPLITHACWALAAAAAFVLGSRQGVEVASASGDASQRPGSARVTASGSSDAAAARATRRAAGSKEPGVANSALAGLFGSIASGLRNPDALAEQAFRDPALRQSSLTRAGQAFYRRDPAGALAWLETSGLPEELRQQVAAPENRR